MISCLCKAGWLHGEDCPNEVLSLKLSKHETHKVPALNPKEKNFIEDFADNVKSSNVTKDVVWNSELTIELENEKVPKPVHQMNLTKTLENGLFK